MHPIAFGLKRAFQATLNLTRHAFRALGVTAARFDMMQAIHESGSLGLPQRQLGASLGVTGATVSRMVRSLEKLGYVTRTRNPYDRRALMVCLTDLGLRILRRAFARLAAHLWLAFDCALTHGKPWSDAECFHCTSSAESMLWTVRGTFRDRATLQYVWHPDD